MRVPGPLRGGRGRGSGRWGLPRAGRLAVVLICIALGCSRGERDDLRGVLLVSIDTLRPDHLGAYGYARPTSPNFDRLAREGVLFEVACSVAPWTLPAHATLLTGLLPHRHGIQTSRKGLPPDIPTLASRLDAAGFRTAAVVNSSYVGRRNGLDRGFHTFQQVPEPERAPSEVADLGLHWLDAHLHDPAPFFLFLHFYDVHSDYEALPRFERLLVRPYQGPVSGSTGQLLRVTHGEVALGDDDLRHLVDLYDASVRQTDTQLGRVLEWLERHGLADRVLVVVTSDHGEEFLEHGGVLHARTHYHEVLRIPLVMRGPGLPHGRRVTRPVSIADVAPTVLSVADVAPGEGDGSDLSRLWRAGASDDADPGRWLVAEGDHGNGHRNAKRSIRNARYKLIQDRITNEVELYDLVNDPEEQDDLSGRLPALRDELLARLEEITADGAPGDAGVALPLSPEEAERLRALGYAEP